DVSAAAGIAVRNDTVAFWVIKDGKRTVPGEQKIPAANTPVYLKMAMLPDFTCRVYWKQQGEWEELTPGKKAYNISFLPPWDRSPRPGLNFQGEPGENAAFSFFDIRYTSEIPQ
ncbi:hypothetical protein, partial [Chitinophaga sp.]|uniref:hypothetical protein n=1 Tax=Chitinophaga sp. TaxID=1869181 RepID=UPI002C65DB48